MERYKRNSEIRRMRLALDAAIIIVGAKREGQYDVLGYKETDLEKSRKQLQEFADPNSAISQIMPATLGGMQDSITKMLELYPKPESSEYMMKILAVLRDASG